MVRLPRPFWIFVVGFGVFQLLVGLIGGTPDAVLFGAGGILVGGGGLGWFTKGKRRSATPAEKITLRVATLVMVAIYITLIAVDASVATTLRFTEAFGAFILLMYVWLIARARFT